MSNLAREIERSIEPEAYLASDLRRSETKTIPCGGGRTSDDLLEWTKFSSEVLEYWNSVRDQLLAIPLHPYQFPVRAYPPEGGAIISDEAEVRGACMTSIFGIINMACRALHLGIQINATSSRWEAKSAVDYAGFLVDGNGNATAVALPIEIKGPWQLKLSNFVSMTEIYESEAKKFILNSLSQIYYYMIVEEVQFAILCSKEQHVFFRRSADPTDKILYASKIVNCGDTNPSVRQCYLYWASKAKEGDTVSSSQVPLTFPSQKWIRIPERNEERGSQGRGSRSITIGGSGSTEGSGSTRGRGGGSRRNRTIARRFGIATNTDGVNVDWLQSLQEMEIHELQLGKVLKHGNKCIVREGKVMGVEACIKVFEFFETYDHLVQFRTEIQVYEHLLPLQGLQIPRLLSYGTLWNQSVGYIAMKKEGDSLKFSDPLILGCSLHKLQEVYKKIHSYKVLHNDVSLENCVLSKPHHVTHPVKVLDFGNSIMFASEEDLAYELEQVKDLCRLQFRRVKETSIEPSKRLQCYEFDVTTG